MRRYLSPNICSSGFGSGTVSTGLTFAGKTNNLMTSFARMNDPKEEAGDGEEPDDRNNVRSPVNHGAENNSTDQVQFHSMPSQSNDDTPREDSNDDATLQSANAIIADKFLDDHET